MCLPKLAIQWLANTDKMSVLGKYGNKLFIVFSGLLRDRRNTLLNFRFDSGIPDPKKRTGLYSSPIPASASHWTSPP